MSRVEFNLMKLHYVNLMVELSNEDLALCIDFNTRTTK